jgi:hypothetical protein
MVKKIIASTILMPALSLGLYAAPVLADFDFEENSIIVTNTNSATVSNVVTSIATTGGNTANGGNGGWGGDAGSISSNGDDVEDASTGRGGRGGNGGDGGGIETGSATSDVVVANVVNSNKTTLNLLNSEEEDVDFEENTVELNNNNYHADVLNSAASVADTGVNTANAGNGKAGGDSGSVSNSGDDDLEEVGTGNGGNGGNGGMGGVAITGSSLSKVRVFNLINRNIVRFR